MKVLLDTPVFLWAITDAPGLSTGQGAMFVDETNELYLSVANIWEMLIKAGLGKLPLPIPTTEYVAKQMEKNRVGLLPIRVAHLGGIREVAAFAPGSV